MILCIDIGNTNTVFAFYNNDVLITSFRLESKLSQTNDEYAVKILGLIEYHNLDVKKIEGIIIASVVPSLDIAFEKMLIKYIGVKPIYVGPGVKTGIKINVDNPKQVGADIIAGAVASVHKYQKPIIFVDMGTAITLFYVDNNTELVGGVIAPGIRTAYDGLFKNTARLEEVKLHQPPKIIGRDTVSCIQSAMVYGTASLVDGIIRKMKNEIFLEENIKPEEIKVILTGGESKLIKHFLEEETIFDRNLIMDGLNLIYKKNR